MGRYAVGLLLIIMGGLFLMQTLGLASGISFGSLVLVFVGLVIAGDGPRRRRFSLFSTGLGLWLAAIGLFNMLSRAGITTTTGGDILRVGWPLLLILLGLSMLLGRGMRVYVTAIRPRKSTQFSSFVGDLNLGTEPWVLDKDLQVQTFAGDLRLDLTTATIAPGVHRIEVTQFVGDTLVRVPDTVSVRARAEAFAGEVSIFGVERSDVGMVYLEREEIVPGADAELIIDARVRFGEVTIERVPISDFRVF
ncbi:putative membrane protein [Symbiobacterium terraclitae]|uniref:Membrane protein n=1 Tax=Symbiobacterium terraclitae TaxID=557451 RepID=A0ABS4JQR0_9FIRM|nr:LiaF domain-containing protein [Symbiobacterium terraclitae]MBP2017874.1 putative membrane protein [Symbiobacterium terraclitae]